MPRTRESLPPETSPNTSAGDIDHGLVHHNPENFPKADLDNKYTTKGRYAVEAFGAQLTISGANSSTVARSELPQVGLLEGSASETEDDADQCECFLARSFSNIAPDCLIDSDGKSSVSSSHEACKDPIESDFAPIVLERSHDYQGDSLSSDAPFSVPGDASLHPDQSVCEIDAPTWGFFSSTSLENVNLGEFFGEKIEADLFIGKDQSFIKVAQVVADQAVARSQAAGSFRPLTPTGTIVNRSPISDFDFGGVTQAVLQLFPTSLQWSLSEYAVFGATAPQFLQDNNESRDIKTRFHLLDPPYTCVMRMGSPLEVLPPALSFWEELSLEPAHGRKDVLAFCIGADEGVYSARSIDTFLEMMQDAYQACKLGVHQLVTDDDGVYAEAEEEGYESFGQTLANIDPWDGVIVVYVVTNDDKAIIPPDLCAASLDLLKGYRPTLQVVEAAQAPDLVIQIVPKSMVFSPHRLVVPSLNEYKKLAFQVYDRCSPRQERDGSPLIPYYSAPAVFLSKPIPRKIDFRLTSDSSKVSLVDDNCIHLAYTWTLEDQWLTASWTDNTGILQWNAVYCVASNVGDPWQPFEDVAKELLETTIEMLHPRNRSWHTIVAKSGPLITNELDGEQSQKPISDSNN